MRVMFWTWITLIAAGLVFYASSAWDTTEGSMRRFIRDHSLSLFFLVIFLASLVGLAIAGHALHNDDAVAHHSSTLSFWRYIVSSDFGNAVMENWQSEYLQFMLFMLATIWLVERGSPESKPPGQQGMESDQKQKIGGHADRRTRPSGRSPRHQDLRLLQLPADRDVDHLLRRLVRAVGHRLDHVQRRAGRPPPGDCAWLGYIGSADFWEATLENWQSEFLAVGSFVAITVFLRQRGSSQSKPVGAPHHSTGVEG